MYLRLNRRGVFQTVWLGSAEVKPVLTKTLQFLNEGRGLMSLLLARQDSKRFPYFNFCSDCSSLIWLPLSFFILSFLPTHPTPRPAFPPSLPPSPLSLIQTYWVRMLSASSLNFLSHRFHHLLIHHLSARLLACQILCSSYFCETACRLKHTHT